MGNFAENLNLGNRFRPPPPGWNCLCKKRPQELWLYRLDLFRGQPKEQDILLRPEASSKSTRVFVTIPYIEGLSERLRRALNSGGFHNLQISKHA